MQNVLLALEVKWSAELRAASGNQPGGLERAW